MRLAIAISVLALSLSCGPARADGPFAFIKVTMDAGVGYIVPQIFAEDHQAELTASIPGQVKIDGFWTPTEPNVTVAERVFRVLLHQAVKDPSVIFPDLAQSTDPADVEALARERAEIELVYKNYDAYVRQYVGIIVDGNKLVLCNYSDAKKVDPATEYMYVEKYFVNGEKTHFLQCRVDTHWQTWSNVSIIGSWLPKEK